LKTAGTPGRSEIRDTSEIRAELVEYLQNWRAMARQGVAEARRLLRAVLVGRFVFTPVPRPPDLPPRKGPGRKPGLIYELKGEATLSGLIDFCKFGGGPNGIRTRVWSRSRFRQTFPLSSPLSQWSNGTGLKHAARRATQACCPAYRFDILAFSEGRALDSS
jgi:hypothetical protein